MEDPRVAKKLVKREVTRVLTPGTTADVHLGSEENNFLGCVARAGNAVGFAALDLSTGEFRATDSKATTARGAYVKNCSFCVPGKCCSLRRCRCSINRAQAHRRR